MPPTPPAPRSPPQPLTSRHLNPCPPVPPTSLLPRTCIARRSASPHGPTAFRAAGDNTATTSQPASPSMAKPEASRNAHRHARFAPNQTPPIKCIAPTPRQRLMATHQDTPSIGTPHPCGTSLPDGCTVREVAVRRVSVRPLKVVDLQRAPRASPRVPACAYRVDVTSR